MSPAEQPRDKGVARFRTRLFTAMMVIVATLTGLGFYLAQRKVTADAERNLQQTFQAELSSLHKLEELRPPPLPHPCNPLPPNSPTPPPPPPTPPAPFHPRATPPLP